MAKSSRPMIRIHDLATDEIIDREMNDVEFAEHKAHLENEAAIKTKAEAKATEKQALLDRLGITADEAKLLLG